MKAPHPTPLVVFCPCGCGRPLAGRQKARSATCRKRLSRRAKQGRGEAANAAPAPPPALYLRQRS